MKKVLIVCALLLCLTGCGAKDEVDNTRPVKDVFLESIQKMKTLDNYEMNMTLDMNYKVSEEEEHLSMNNQVLIDEKNKIYKLTYSFSDDEDSYNTESYMQLLDEGYLSYSKSEETWYKSTYHEETTVTEIFNIINDVTEVKEVSNGKYQLILSDEALKKLIEAYEFNDVCNPDSIVVYAYFGNDYITGVDIIFPIEYVEDETIIGTGEVKLIFKFSKFNELGEVKIPEEIINNAISTNIENW